MKKTAAYILILLIVFSACSPKPESEESGVENPPAQEVEAPVSAAPSGEQKERESEVIEEVEEEKEEKEEIFNPYSDVPPDETGKIIIIMFHKFYEEYEEGLDKTMATTLDEFRLLLQKLYDDGYRTASLNDFIDGSISVQRGAKPIIFTFDDGWSSQFSLIENADGSLSENPNTAVSVMEEFYNEHPDFGLNGTFFVNFGTPATFGQAGHLKQRLEMLLAKGFQIENHTYNHANLSKAESAEEIQEEIGKNEKEYSELTSGKKMSVLSLPLGANAPEGMREYLEKGSFDGYEYHNKGIMLVGAEPAMQMYLKDADPLRIRRVMSTGIEPVECDLSWWLDRMDDVHEFISDGDPDIVTVPKDKLDLVDEDKIKALGKEIAVID